MLWRTRTDRRGRLLRAGRGGEVHRRRRMRLRVRAGSLKEDGMLRVLDKLRHRVTVAEDGLLAVERTISCGCWSSGLRREWQILSVGNHLRPADETAGVDRKTPGRGCQERRDELESRSPLARNAFR